MSVAQKAAVAVVCTWIAGFVDTIGYLLLAQIFSGNMTGNVVRVSIGSASLSWNQIAQRGWPVLAFVSGLVISATIHEAGTRRGFLRTSATVFLLESALFGTFIALQLHSASILQTSYGFGIGVLLLSFGMGLQNATLTRVGALSVKTTHVTGTFTEFAEGFSVFMFWTYDRLRAKFPGRMRRVLRTAWRQRSLQKSTMMAALAIAFFLGGVSAVLANYGWGRFAIFPPIPLLVGLAAIDLVRPIAASEEHPSQAAQS